MMNILFMRHSTLLYLNLKLTPSPDRILYSFPLDEQFRFFEPLLGEKSQTYKNGPEARKKRQLVDRSFSHDTVTRHYYEYFTEVI